MIFIRFTLFKPTDDGGDDDDDAPMSMDGGGVSASGRRDKISEKKVLCISFRSFPGSCTMVAQFVRMCFRRAVAAAAGRSFLSLFMIRYAVCII